MNPLLQLLNHGVRICEKRKETFLFYAFAETSLGDIEHGSMAIQRLLTTTTHEYLEIVAFTF